MHNWICRSFVLVGVVLLTPWAEAQQGIQYGLIPNPYLFLLREPAVWDDLELTSQQKEELLSVNARVDGRLLRMRNLPNEAADKLFAELLTETQRGVEPIFDRNQQRRLTQVQLRVRGIECLQDDQVAEALKLTTTQRDTMRDIIQDARAALAAIREQVQAGKPREPLEKEYLKQSTDEQKKLLSELTPKQKEQLTTLLGRTLDVSKLGRVTFKAPEFVAGGEWLNSKPLRMEQIRGRVVALHFWTFG